MKRNSYGPGSHGRHICTDLHWSAMSCPISVSRRDWLCSAAAAAFAGAAQSSTEDKVLLSIGGKLGRPDRDGRALFDMKRLQGFPQHSLTQKTPWYAGPRKFSGPLLREVLAAAGAQGQSIEAIAINDYKVTIPMDDVKQHDVMLALQMDDRPMPLRDKGPLFIIYPFDSDPRLRTSIYYARCAWQLKALEIR